MSSAIVLVAALHIHPGHEAEFEQFETAAASIMKGYGGAIERRVGFAAKNDPSVPHEVHIVTFPDSQSFDRYRADPDLAKLADLRTRAIRQTTVWHGADLAPFLK